MKKPSETLIYVSKNSAVRRAQIDTPLAMQPRRKLLEMKFLVFCMSVMELALIIALCIFNPVNDSRALIFAGLLIPVILIQIYTIISIVKHWERLPYVEIHRQYLLVYSLTFYGQGITNIPHKQITKVVPFDPKGKHKDLLSMKSSSRKYEYNSVVAELIDLEMTEDFHMIEFKKTQTVAGYFFKKQADSILVDVFDLDFFTKVIKRGGGLQ